ncbi:zinc finger and BTB domain-containing protein 49-like isoform X1 [Mytilus trossulus]|uniref:zinc finger and BTB domain-containing protein 49-like isoform X1 n=1 Tax=Mytilus trossulus TaxID=6551 RepID=UPI00300485E5
MPSDSEVKVPGKRAGRPVLLTDSDRKRRKAERNAVGNKSKIYIGNQYDRWATLKEEIGAKSHAEVAKVLLDRYDVYGSQWNKTPGYESSASTTVAGPSEQNNSVSEIMESTNNWITTFKEEPADEEPDESDRSWIDQEPAGLMEEDVKPDVSQISCSNKESDRMLIQMSGMSGMSHLNKADSECRKQCALEQSKSCINPSEKMVDSFIVNALDESFEGEGEVKIEPSEVEEELETEPSSMYYCTFCSYTSKHKQNVKRHTQNAHTSGNNAETMFVCDQCGSVFKTAGGLKIHYKGKHTQEFRFKCKVCDRGFNTLWNYRGHITTHEPVLRHRCDVCDKTFAFKETLKQHITSVHTNETSSIICSKEGCGASCNSQKSLKEHFLAVHGGRVLKCDLCGKSFKWRSSLKYHKEHVHC